MSYAIRLVPDARLQVLSLPRSVGWYVCARLFDLAEDPTGLSEPPMAPYPYGMVYRFSAAEARGPMFLLRFQLDQSEEILEVFFVQHTPLRHPE